MKYLFSCVCVAGAVLFKIWGISGHESLVVIGVVTYLCALCSA